MKAHRLVLLVAWMGAATAWAEPANEASIRELLSITDAEKSVETMRTQIDSMMDAAAIQNLAGVTPTAEQQQSVERMRQRVTALLKEQLAWDKLQPMYVRLYMETFTEEEVQDILAFYRTPSGRVLLDKMPGLMQKSMQEARSRMTDIGPQLQEIMKDFMDEVMAQTK